MVLQCVKSNVTIDKTAQFYTVDKKVKFVENIYLSKQDLEHQKALKLKIRLINERRDQELDIEYRTKMKNVCKLCGCIKSENGDCLCD